MIDSEVIIVGGGPAGSSCAWKLGQSNVECLVLEKKEFPRDKLCGGMVTPGVIKKLKIDIKDYPHSLLTFDSLDIHIFGNHINFKGTIYSIRRVEFDHWLLKHSGAQINCHTVKNIRKDGNQYVIDDQYRCKYLMGAGGTNCPVYRTYFKDSCPRHPLSLIATMEQEIPYKWQDGRCQIWFFENGFPGYSWYIPKADNHLIVGMGGLLEVLKANNDLIKKHWDIFLRKLKRLSLVKDSDFKPKGAIYYLKNEIETGRIENAFVIGDAAGLATRDMGEGIYPAVKSGILAAEAIVKNTDFSLKDFKKYSMGVEIGKLIEHCAGVNAAIIKLKNAMK
jgi:flavin-dependent dehydrogenase